MILAQVMGPVLLAVGFLVRPLALLMLILTLLAQSLGAPQDEHLFWAALFGWYVVQGAGPLSLDRVLAKGLANSPLPLARQAIAASGWVNREGGPIYLLGLRLWLAAALTWPVMAPQCCRLWHPGCCLCPWLRSAPHCWGWVCHAGGGGRSSRRGIRHGGDGR